MNQDRDPNTHSRKMAHAENDAVRDRFSNLRRTYLIRGVAFLILGLIALFWPSGSVSLLLRICGFVLVLDGVVHMLGVRQAGAQLEEVFFSLPTALVGVVLLLMPMASIKLAFILLGLWAIVAGGSYLLSWWRQPKNYPERDKSRNTGIIALLVGMILVFWPGTGPVALGWTLAFMILLASAAMFYLASSFRRVNDIL